MTNKLQETLEVIIYGEIKNGYPKTDNKDYAEKYDLYIEFYHDLGPYLSDLLAKELLKSKLIKIEKSDDK